MRKKALFHPLFIDNKAKKIDNIYGDFLSFVTYGDMWCFCHISEKNIKEILTMSFPKNLGRVLFGTSDEDEIEETVDILSKNSDTEKAPVTLETGKKANKVVNINATTQLQVVLVKPERFDEATAIADHLNEKKTVVLNLEAANKELSRRLLDFLSGVAYANDGQIKRVANSTYMITPFNVDLMGELMDELESNGVYF